MPTDFPPRPAHRPAVHYGRLTLGSRYFLSPLAGYTNLPFRRIVREIGGVGLATTDLVNCRGLVARNSKTLRLIDTCPQDRPFAVQIFGNDAQLMCEAARYLEGEHGVDSIDINMGCPVDRVANNGSGAGMMCQFDQTVNLARAIVEAVSIPVTVKMRLGWDETQITAPRFARAFEQVGVAAIAIHGRTRAQGFRGTVNLEGIRQVVEAVEAVPVIGNGDVRTVADAARMLSATGCQAVSVGRGALANPWIFRQLAQWEATGRFDPPGTFDERLQLMLRQFGYLQEQLGAEYAIISFRKMGHWYLKSMRVRAWLRNRFQQACTREEFDAVLREIAAEGPIGGARSGELPGMHIPVPSGPVERW